MVGGGVRSVERWNGCFARIARFSEKVFRAKQKGMRPRKKSEILGQNVFRTEDDGADWN